MSVRPHVLFLSGWPIGSRGEGAASFVYDQIEALAGSVQATYVEPRFTSIARWPMCLGRGADLERIRDLWPQDVEALIGWVPRWPARVTRRHHLEDLRRSARGLARRLTRRFGPIHLVHAHVVLPAGLVGAAIAEALGVPLLLQEHSGPFDMHLDSPEKREAVAYALDRARVVGAVGARLAERIRLVAAGSTEVRITPNLVRTDIFRARPRRTDRHDLTLVTVASLVPIKGLDVLLRALVALRRAGISARAHIVGGGDERPRLERLITELGLADRVEFHGVLPRRDVADVVARSDIYVCTSTLETFGLAPAESLAIGRPVVTTRCGGPEDFVDDCSGATVPTGDASALAAAIEQVASRLDAYEPDALHRRIDDRFGPVAFRVRMSALYEELLR